MANHGGAIWSMLLLLCVGLAGCEGRKSPTSSELVSAGLTAPFENADGAYPNEPVGFRTLRWNAPLKETIGFKVRMREAGIMWYVRSKEPHLLGEIPVQEVRYGFDRDGALIAGWITFDERRYAGVLAYLETRFGRPTNSHGPNSKIRLWNGDLTLLKLYGDKLVVVYSPAIRGYRRGIRGRPSFLDDFY